MKKLATISIILMFAVIGLTFGAAENNMGKCTCPGNTTCSQSACGANCGGLCAHVTTSNSSATATFQCGSHCPMKMCGNADDCKACCGPNCADCCGKANF